MMRFPYMYMESLINGLPRLPSCLPMHPGVSHMFCFGDPNSTVSTGRRPGWIWPGWIWGWRERSVWPKFQTKILTKLMRGQFGQNFSFFQGILPKVEVGLGESDQLESVKGFFSLVIDSSLFMYVQLWAKCLSFSNLFEVELFKVLSLHWSSWLTQGDFVIFIVSKQSHHNAPPRGQSIQVWNFPVLVGESRTFIFSWHHEFPPGEEVLSKAPRDPWSSGTCWFWSIDSLWWLKI